MSRARDLANVADDVSTGTVVTKDGSNDVTLNDITANSVFLGGTGAANQLDDYEEGTFTPTFTAGGGGETYTYQTQAGTYLKIGRLVHASVQLRLDTPFTAGSGSLLITGLPFTTLDTHNTGSSPVFANKLNNFHTRYGTMSETANNTTQASIRYAVNVSTMGTYQATDLTDDTQIRLNFTYYTSA